MQQAQLMRGAQLSLTPLDLPAIFRCSGRCRTQKHSNFPTFVTFNGSSSSGAESTSGRSGRHTPRPRQLDREAAALLRGGEASADLIQTALTGLGIVAVAAAAGLELLSSVTRHQHETARTQAAEAFRNQIGELQAEMETAEAKGRRGRHDMDGIQRRQVQIVVDASAAAAPPPSFGAARSWSLWALCLALLCQLLLATLTIRRCTLTQSHVSSQLKPVLR